MRILFYAIYQIAFYLPKTSSPIVGRFSKKIKYLLVKNMFKKCGKNVNIDRKARFGLGAEIEIGDNSGIGINATIPSNTCIGNYVMIGPDCIIYGSNHRFDRKDIPIMMQGNSPRKKTIIGNDVWIGGRVIILPGIKIGDGVIIGAGSVVTKNLEPYSVYAGNPAKMIKRR